MQVIYKLVLKLKLKLLIVFVEIPLVSHWETYPFNKSFFTNTIKYWKTILPVVLSLSPSLSFGSLCSHILFMRYEMKKLQKRNKRSKILEYFYCWSFNVSFVFTEIHMYCPFDYFLPLSLTLQLFFFKQ